MAMPKQGFAPISGRDAVDEGVRLVRSVEEITPRDEIPSVRRLEN